MPKKGKKKSSFSKASGAETTAVTEQIFSLKRCCLENGSCPFDDWVRGIKDAQAKQRILIRLARIERGNMGDCQPVGEGVSEFRLHFGPGYRIYYALEGTTIIILLAGGTKSTQTEDIKIAKQLWKDYRNDTERRQ